MILSKKGGDFVPAPEFTGRAVCVDVTEPKEVESRFGKQMKFKLVFEIDSIQDEGDHKGEPWCVWSMPFALSLHEKAGFRKMLKQWFGRDLTAEEQEAFDTESLIGMPAQIVVTHTPKADDPTVIYANIAACLPHRTGPALAPSGKFKRQKDRDTQGNSYKKTEAPAGVKATVPTSAVQAAAADPMEVKVHVGRCKGVDFKDLGASQIQKLAEMWLPVVQAQPKKSADDVRLINAIEAWTKEFEAAKAAAETKVAGDNLPY